MKDLGDNFSKIRTFNIEEYELLSFSNGEWDTFYTGDLIGAAKIIKLPTKIAAEKIKLKILKSKGNPSIYHFSVSDESTKGIRIVTK